MIIKCYQIPSADSSSSGATLWSEAESNNTKQLTSFTVHVLYLFIYLQNPTEVNKVCADML